MRMSCQNGWGQWGEDSNDFHQNIEKLNHPNHFTHNIAFNKFFSSIWIRNQRQTRTFSETIIIKVEKFLLKIVTLNMMIKDKSVVKFRINSPFLFALLHKICIKYVENTQQKEKRSTNIWQRHSEFRWMKSAPIPMELCEAITTKNSYSNFIAI